MQPSVTDDDHPWSLHKVNYGGHHRICSRLTSCRQIGGQKMAGMQQSTTKGQPDLLSTMMNVFNKFEINPWGYLSRNVWTPWKCDGWIDRRINSRMNGQTSQFLCQWRIWHHVYLPIPVRLWFFTQSQSNYYSEKRWSLRGADMMESCVKLLNCVSLNMWPEQRVCDFSDIFKFVLFKSLFFKFHWIMILISCLMISQHWFSQACHLC